MSKFHQAFFLPARSVIVFWSLAAVPLLAPACLMSCGRTPDSKPIVVPKSSGNRESVYGKAMDQAEDLQTKVADYNATIEKTIEQGANEKPKSPPRPAPP